jgi:Spy/CpxP family protein refolding chaperone
MKRITLISGILFMSIFLVLPAFADNRDWGRGRQMKGHWQDGRDATQRNFNRFNNLTVEQQNQIKALRQNLFDKTADLRTQVIAKSAELNIFLNTTAPDVEKAKALQKELSDLQAMMDQERIVFLLELRKIDPDFRMGTHRMGKGNPRTGGPANMRQQPDMMRYGPGVF